ncbi:hypothetical protein ACKGJN_16830, partial [Gillisia sp. Q332]
RARIWGCAARERAARKEAPADPALKLLLDRGDERLLRDAGLTRDDVLGPAGIFWHDWMRRLRHRML